MNAVYRLRFYLKNWRLCVRRLCGQRCDIVVGHYTSSRAPAIRWWGERAAFRMGKFCSIARDVTIFLGGNHRSDWITTYPFMLMAPWRHGFRREGHPATRGDVVIGNDVWLCEGCTILSGVHIGDGAVVGAYAVVSRDVPAYAIVAGNPARVVRYRFSRPEIDHLLALRWWDWDDVTIREKLDTLSSPDVTKLQR